MTTKKKDLENLERLLKTLASIEKRFSKLSEERDFMTDELFAIMKKLRITTAASEDLVAEIIRPAGRATKFIDPRDLWKVIHDEDKFFACVKVMIEKTKEAISNDDFSKIVVVHPGEYGEETIKIRLGNRKEIPSKPS